MSVSWFFWGADDYDVAKPPRGFPITANSPHEAAEMYCRHYDAEEANGVTDQVALVVKSADGAVYRFTVYGEMVASYTAVEVSE